MPVDVEVAAAPSAVETTSEPIEIPRSGSPEYAEWRKSGTIPAKTSEAKPVDPPATDTPKAENAVDPEPAAGKQQESRRKPDAEARIRELTERQKQLERELEEARKPKEAKADPPPARQPEYTRPKPKVDDQKDGKPLFATYEEYVEELADWKAEQRMAARDLELANARQMEAFEKEVGEARKRYEDFDSKAIPFAHELISQKDTPQYLVDALKESPVMHELLYTLGQDEATKADFLKTARKNPTKAMRVLLIMEQSIQQEHAKAGTERNDNGQFKAKETAPAKRGPETAPAPPIEIGNRGGIPKETDAAETGDFRAFARERNAQDLRRLKGA